MDEKRRVKKYLFRKKVLAVCLTFIIMFYFAINLIKSGEVLYENAKESAGQMLSGDISLKQMVGQIEESLTDDAYERMKFVELFSYTNVLLDKREINNFAYIKDETGSLHYSSFYRERQTELFEYAMRVKRLKDYVGSRDTEVLFVVAPSKFVPNDNRLRSGMPVNNPQPVVDELLFYLNRLGVDTLDLNRVIPCKEVPYEEAFFRTDHHWTIDAAYYSTKVLAQRMNEDFGYDLDTETYLSEDSYTTVRYEQGMLGSMGRGSGANFSGLDDFNAYYPNFKMNFYRNTLGEDGLYRDQEGDIIGTLVLPDVLKNNSNIYSDSQYSLYINGLRQHEQIKNLDTPEGLKIFMIRDSYFSPVMAFMAPMCGEIDAMWSLEDMDQLNIEEYIRSNEFDCIIIEFYPYNIGEEGFRFFEGE